MNIYLSAKRQTYPEKTGGLYIYFFVMILGKN